MSSTLTSCSVWMDLRRYNVHYTSIDVYIHVHVYMCTICITMQQKVILHYLRCTLYVTTLRATTERYLVCTYSGYGFFADIQEYPTD